MPTKFQQLRIDNKGFCTWRRHFLGEEPKSIMPSYNKDNDTDYCNAKFNLFMRNLI